MIPKNNLTQKNWDKKIITSQNNLNCFFQKTPPFSGGWGGGIVYFTTFFFFQNMKVLDLKIPNLPKKQNPLSP